MSSHYPVNRALMNNRVAAKNCTNEPPEVVATPVTSYGGSPGEGIDMRKGGFRVMRPAMDPTVYCCGLKLWADWFLVGNGGMGYWDYYRRL